MTSILSRKGVSAVLASGVLLISACAATPKRPVWVDGSAGPAESMDGVGFSGYQAGDSESLKKARDSAYSDAMQKLSLKLRAVVKGEVKTELQTRVSNASEVTDEKIEAVTGSVFNAVLGRKRFDEFRDERRQEYWVRCSMTREDAEAAIKEALAAAARERSMKSVYVQFPGGEAGLRSLAEAEFQRCFADKGYAVMAVSVEARVLVSGEVRTEDMGQARALGVDVGRSCRASLRVEALFGVGEAGQKKISGFKDAAGIGRTPAQ